MGEYVMMAVFVGLLVLALWVQAVAGLRLVRVQPGLANVIVTWRTAFLRRRKVEFPLSMFRSVVSYNQPGRYPRTRVELVSESGMQSLLVASYPAGSIAKSFWSFPRDAEAEDARNARLSVARTSGLTDEGFVGNRLPGEQLL